MRKLLEEEKNEFKLQVLRKIESTILLNTVTTLKAPNIFGEDLYGTEIMGFHFTKILRSTENANFISFLENVIVKLDAKEDKPNDFITQMFDKLHDEVKSWTLSNTMFYCETLELLSYIASKKHLGLELLRHSFPSQKKNGRAWENTLLGSMFAISVYNKKGETFEFFKTYARFCSIHSETPCMLISDYKINEQNAYSNTDLLFGYVLRIWENLLIGSADSKHMALQWIAQCLQANKGRKTEMANH